MLSIQSVPKGDDRKMPRLSMRLILDVRIRHKYVINHSRVK